MTFRSEFPQSNVVEFEHPWDVSSRDADTAGLTVVLSATDVDEDATQGDTIAIITATGDATLDSFSLLSDTDSKFEVFDDTGGSGDWLLRVRTGASFDYETATSHTLTIRATDTDTNTYDQLFTITVNNVAEGTEGVPMGLLLSLTYAA